MDLQRLILVILSIAGLAFWLRNRIRHHRIQKRAQHGHIMEDRAADMLKAWGFRILERNPRIEYTWWVNGEAIDTTVEADYLVSADGKRWLVEVKTGRAARPNRRETRRQLLEYASYGQADGLYLLDADRKTLEVIEFPTGEMSPNRSGHGIWFIFFVLGTLIGLFCAHWD